MNRLFFTALLASLVGAPWPSSAAITLDASEVDIRVRYSGGTWNWQAFAHQSEESFNLSDVIFRANAGAERPVPANPAYTSFLGPAGSSIWLLPTPEEQGLLWLGIDGSETGSGIFASDRLNVTLTAVSGPGHFALYHVHALGAPQVFMNSRDGFSSADAVSLSSASGHLHVNWAFSAPGEYALRVIASGTLADTGEVVSGPVTEWRFTVVPEPGSAALLVFGAAALAMQRQRANLQLSSSK